MTEPPAEPRRRPPVRRIGRREVSATEAAALAKPGPEVHEVDPVSHTAVWKTEPTDEAAARRGELLVAGLFLLSALGTIGFCAVWFFTRVSGANLQHLRYINFAMGTGLTVALLAVGAAFILWSKRLMPHIKYVQEREPMHSAPEDELAAEQVFLDGVAATGLARRSLIKRTMGLALGLLPLPAFVALRDLGPRPKDDLRHTPWAAGTRLISLDTGLPVMVGDLPIGGFVTVMPEGHTDPVANALAPTVLIRLPPGANRPLPGRQTWTVDDQYIAYSKICTHVGCPIGLYEQQSHHMLCPCHQSTFLATEGAKVIFGPAARNLPQLPLAVDPSGYLVAAAPYDQPVGPSFWERG